MAAKVKNNNREKLQVLNFIDKFTALINYDNSLLNNKL